MNLKKITHATFPYVLLLAIGLALAGTVWWADPVNWLQQVLAVDRYELSLAAYSLVMIAATIFAPLTIAVTIPFMAKIFGPLAIFIVTWFSWMVASIAIFYITRYWGKPLVGRVFDLHRLESIEARLPKHLDFWVLLLLRTFLPVDVLSYAVGLFSTINFRKYISATAIGIVPFAFILSYGPDAITGDEPWLLFGFLLVSTTIVAAILIYNFAYLLRPKVRIYTHDGKFHTDDVFAVATLQMILEQQQRRYEVIRTRDAEKLDKAKQDALEGKEVFVVDVGDVYDPEHNLFDHHQPQGAGKRESGIEYASFGLVWQKYGVRLCDNDGDVVAKVDEIFIQAIDGPDNGHQLFELAPEYRIPPITLYELIELHYRTSEVGDASGLNDDFSDAVVWAKTMIPRVVHTAEQELKQSKLAGQVYAEAEDKRIMVTTKYVGRRYFTRFEEALFIVSPRTNDPGGDWGVAVIPAQEHGTRGRVEFPESWWGLRGEELEAVSGIEGAKFCHRSGDFIAVANSQKAAEKMAQVAADEYETRQK